MFGLLADQGVGSIPWSPLAGGMVARPWGDKSTNRAQGSADVDFHGNPLWLDSDKEIVDAIQRTGVPLGRQLDPPHLDDPGFDRRSRGLTAITAVAVLILDAEPFTVTAEGEPKLTTRLLEPVELGATPLESTNPVKGGIVVGTATSALKERHFLSSCEKPATERSWLGSHLNLGPGAGSNAAERAPGSRRGQPPTTWMSD